jgi:hypothetical protein
MIATTDGKSSAYKARGNPADIHLMGKKKHCA